MGAFFVERPRAGAVAKCCAVVNWVDVVKRPPFVPIEWTPDEDAQMGTVSDHELGRRLHVDPHTIAARRRALGIPVWQKSKTRHTRTCIVCGREFVVTGGRLSQMRKTCPPTHRFTSTALSPCHKLLIARAQMITHNQPLSARGLVKQLGAANRVIRLLDDD
jgi:hypothetical protein